MKSFDTASLLAIPELPNYLYQVQQQLEKVINSTNPNIFTPAKRLIDAPSKRLRPVLVIASAESKGGKVNPSVISACVAIELIHLASLVHDDIMDNAASRWNAPAVHVKEGLNQAILVGDYLFAKANVVAASISPQIAKVVAETIVSLCEGQSREMADMYNQDRSIESYLSAIRGKTGSLISAACEAGALCAGLNKAKVSGLSNFGVAFGMAFQLIDDILDLVSSPAHMGKPVGNDIAEGVYTMPVILTLQGTARKQLLAELQSAKKAPFTGNDLLIQSGSIRQTIEEAEEYNRQATGAIASFASNGLMGLPSAYQSWALNNLVLKKYRPL